MTSTRRRPVVLVGAAATVVLTALSLLTVAILGGNRSVPGRFPAPAHCAVSDSRGTVVRVASSDAEAMMDGMMPHGGDTPMRLTADPAMVPAGTVSFLVTNYGSIPHEALVLPVAAGTNPGGRTIESDGRIDESDSLGEASNSCGEGTGDGIAPGASSWMTVTLPAGRYELLCNFPGHYGDGMFTLITVV